MYLSLFASLLQFQTESPMSQFAFFVKTSISVTHGRISPSLQFVGVNPVVLEKKDFKIHCIFAISFYLHLETGCGLPFKHNWIPIIPTCLVPILVETGPVVLEKSKKRWKVYGSDDKDDDGQSSLKLSPFCKKNWISVPYETFVPKDQCF